MSIFGPSVEKKVVQVNDDNYPKRSVGFLKPAELKKIVVPIGPGSEKILVIDSLPQGGHFVVGQEPTIAVAWDSLNKQPAFWFITPNGLGAGFATMYARCIRGGTATYSLAAETPVGETTMLRVLSSDMITVSPEFTFSNIPMHLEFGFCFRVTSHGGYDVYALKGSMHGSLTFGICYEIEIKKYI